MTIITRGSRRSRCFRATVTHRSEIGSAVGEALHPFDPQAIDDGKVSAARSLSRNGLVPYAQTLHFRFTLRH